jgi:hypothetical protein
MNGHELGRRNIYDLNEALSRYLPGKTERKELRKILCQFGQRTRPRFELMASRKQAQNSGTDVSFFIS